MTGQSMRNAEKGLREKQLMLPQGRLDVRGFIGWARHADPAETRTAGRGPTKQAAPKVHPECKSGCAMEREEMAIRKSLFAITPFTAIQISKPVLPEVTSPDVLRGADLPKTLPPPAPVPPTTPDRDMAGGSTQQEDPEVKWVKTLAAIRAGFASAGVGLLMRLLTVLWSLKDLAGVSDYVLAAAVTLSYSENIRRMNGPGLLVSTVPEILKGWAAQGRALDAEGPGEKGGAAPGGAVPPYPREAEDTPVPSVWMRIRRELRKRMSATQYENWIERSEFSSMEHGDLVVFVPDSISMEWFEHEYADSIRAIARELDVGVKRVIFKVPEKAA
jgi:hypothetical protein